MLIAHGRCREQRRKRLSRFSLDQKLAGPAFAGGAALENLAGVLPEEWRRRQFFDWLADCFVGGPSIQLLRKRIPENDEAVGIRRHDGLLHGVEELCLEPDRGFGAGSLRYVRHRADHAYCSASVVARDVTAIHDVGVGAVGAAVPIVIAPAGSPAIYHCLKTADYPIPILHMQVIAPPLYFRVNPVLLVAEHSLH